MDAMPNIQKKAFIAMMNNQAKRLIVDTAYKTVGKSTRLVLIYDNGEREVFSGVAV